MALKKYKFSIFLRKKLQNSGFFDETIYKNLLKLKTMKRCIET